MEREQLKHIALMARYLVAFYEKIDGYQKQYYTMLKELASFQKGINLLPLELMFLSDEEPKEKAIRKGQECMVTSDTAWCLSDAQENLKKVQETLREIVPIFKNYSADIDRLYDVYKSLGECISYLAEVGLFDDEEYEEMKKKSIGWRFFYENQDR